MSHMKLKRHEKSSSPIYVALHYYPIASFFLLLMVSVVIFKIKDTILIVYLEYFLH
jgi:hypothetical protein